MFRKYLVLVLFALAVSACSNEKATKSFDLLVVNGTIYDGSGAEPFVGDRFLGPLCLFGGQRRPDRVDPPTRGIADHSAPAASDVEEAVDHPEHHGVGPDAHRKGENHGGREQWPSNQSPDGEADIPPDGSQHLPHS